MVKHAVSSSSLTLVTAADARYARCLWQLLRSAERQRIFQRGHRVAVWDLGLEAGQLERLRRRFPQVEIHRFDYGNYPSHVHPAQRTYAWKPLVLAEAAHRYGPRLLWLDSAALLHDDLTEVSTALDLSGIYALNGQAALKHRGHSDLFRKLGTSAESLDAPEFAAGVIGFDLRHAGARAVFERWTELARDPVFWRPVSASNNPEQALLSALIRRALADGALDFSSGEIDISSPRPIRWTTSRNKVPPWLPEWADVLARAWYRTYKTIDQLGLRWRAFHATKLSGWHRIPKERFRTYVGHLNGEGREVRAPAGSYYADPFLFHHRGVLWIFLEEFRYAHNRARLIARPLDETGEAGTPRFLALPPGHRSFPWVFAHEESIFLLCESSQHESVDLYRSTEFPDQWVHHRRLLDHSDAADSTLVHHADRWWLFTALRATMGSGPRSLAIFSAPTLDAAFWDPHPCNAERRYAERPFTSGRNAGAFLRLNDGTLLRPTQENQNYYGEQIQFREVAVLNQTNYEERPYSGVHPLAELAHRVSPHHISSSQDWVAWDVRDRVSYGQHVPIWKTFAVQPSPLARRNTTARKKNL